MTEHAAPPSVPLAEQLQCVAREVAMRERVYPRLIGNAQMPRERAERELGYRCAPVVRVDAAPEKAAALNVLFNRSTNDMQTRFEPLRACPATPDLPAVPPDDFPCLAARPVSVRRLCAANAGRWNRYARNTALSLRAAGIWMPVVITPDERVVNGTGRLEVAAEKGDASVDAVMITDEQAHFAALMLNRLSMDFDFHGEYADKLRFNAYRRPRRVRDGLGLGFVWFLGFRRAADFRLANPAHVARLRKRYGDRLLDFGAGHLTETQLLRRAGFDVTPFEPYHIVGDEVSTEASRRIARDFLRAVAEGRGFDSIFVSSVLNSVPFLADRQHIVTILAALSGARTVVYACCSSPNQSGWRHANAQFLSRTNGSLRLMVADYEPRITIGDMQDAPKVQKYHTPQELYDLFKLRFSVVQTNEGDKNTYAQATGPLPLDAGALRRALAFEFDLPYADGTRLGLVRDAVAAFEARLAVTLGE